MLRKIEHLVIDDTIVDEIAAELAAGQIPLQFDAVTRESDGLAPARAAPSRRTSEPTAEPPG
jgi:hypothetical protein